MKTRSTMNWGTFEQFGAIGSNFSGHRKQATFKTEKEGDDNYNACLRALERLRAGKKSS